MEEKPSVNSDETSCQEVSSTTTDTKEMPAVTDTAEINGQDELQGTGETKDSVENNEGKKEENKDEKKDEKVSLKVLSDQLSSSLLSIVPNLLQCLFV